MPQKRPAMLFSFANDAQAVLRLGEEQDACSNAIAPVHDNGIVEYFSLSYATLNSIYDAFDRFNDRIYTFHFAGHSDGEGLYLKDTIGKDESLATILGRQKNLKLVFLNGCANAKQVETLLAKGVKAIIATTADVSDRKSLQLADRFYRAMASGQNIGEAFDTAASFVKNNSEIVIDYVFRGLGLQNVPSEVFPWGLYVQDKSVLNWSINDIEKATKKELIQVLRQASRERHKIFTSKGGRFYYLKIDKAIMAGIKDVKQYTGYLIEDNVKLHEERRSLDQSLPILWKENCHHAMITGPGGMGKTVSLLRLWERWAKTEALSTPIPIFIQLNEYNNRPEKDFIRNYIQAHYSKIELDELLNTPGVDQNDQHCPQIVLLLDGLNEVSGDKSELLREINQLKVQENFPGVQLVLSSRVDMRSIHQWHAFHLLELQELTNEQIKKYIQKETPGDPRLLELLRNPMMLSIYAAQSELPLRYHDQGLLKEKVTSPGELLYNVEVIQRIKIEERHTLVPKDQILHRLVLEHLLPLVAWELQLAGSFSIGEDKKEAAPGLLSILIKVRRELLSNNFFRVFKDFRKLDKIAFQDMEDWQLLEQLIDRICCEQLVLLVKENEEYRFHHQIFRDYFAARHVQNQIQLALKEKVLPNELSGAPLDFHIRQLLGELEGEHTNVVEWSAANHKWQWSKKHFFLENLLYKLLEQCRGIFNQAALGYTVWNLLTIWKEQRGELSGALLHQLDLFEFSLNGLRASRPGLSACLSEGKVKTENLLALGHSSGVMSIAYHPDGRQIVTASSDRTARIWDVQNGRCEFIIEGHSEAIMSVAYNHDGSQMVTGSYDQTARVWDARNGQHLLTLEGHLAGVLSVAFSADGRQIVTGSDDKTFKIWDVQSGQCLLTFAGHSSKILSVAFSPDMGQIVTGSEDHTARVWDVKSRHCLVILEGHFSLVRSVVFSPDGNCILTASNDKTAKVWDVHSGDCLLTLEGHSSLVRSAVFSPDGKRIVTSSNDHTARVWDAQSGRCLLLLEGHSFLVRSAAFSPDGKQVITGSDDKTAKIWDVQSGYCLLTLHGHSFLVKSATYSPNGAWIVTGSKDKTVKIWDAQTGKCLVILEGHLDRVMSTGWRSDGVQVVSGSSDHTAKIWDVQSGQCLLTLEGHTSAVRSASYNYEGDRIVTGSSDETAKVWDAQSGQCVLTLKGHTSAVMGTAYSPDDKQIVTASNDKTAKIWDAQSGRCLLTLVEHSDWIRSIAYSPDGRRIVIGSNDHTASVWDVPSGRCLLILKGHANWVRSAAYSPKGDYIVTGSNDNTAKVWDAWSGQCLLTLQGHSDRVMSTAFSPDGLRIVSSSSDNTAKIWDAQNGKCLLTLPNISGLFIQGCDFRKSQSDLEDEEIGLLRQYGGIFSDEDARQWKELLESILK